MEQEKKKLNVKIIIPIVVAVIVVIVGIVIVKNNKLTQEEQLAVDYLLCNSIIKPNTTEIHRAWVYEENGKWYFAYDMTTEFSMLGKFEMIYGNEEGLTLEVLSNLKINSLSPRDFDAPAKEKGKKLNANKIQKAFAEQY